MNTKSHLKFSCHKINCLIFKDEECSENLSSAEHLRVVRGTVCNLKKKMKNANCVSANPPVVYNSCNSCMYKLSTKL